MCHFISTQTLHPHRKEGLVKIKGPACLYLSVCLYDVVDLSQRKSSTLKATKSSSNLTYLAH